MDKLWGFGGWGWVRGGVGGTGKCPQLISWGVYQAGSAAMAFVSQEWEKEGEGWSRNGNNLISRDRIWHEISPQVFRMAVWPWTLVGSITFLE